MSIHRLDLHDRCVRNIAKTIVVPSHTPKSKRAASSAPTLLPTRDINICQKQCRHSNPQNLRKMRYFRLERESSITCPRKKNPKGKGRYSHGIHDHSAG